MEDSAAQIVISMNEYNDKYSCECKEQINVQSQLIDSLRTRIEELETDFFIKNQDIKELQRDFQSICDSQLRKKSVAKAKAAAEEADVFKKEKFNFGKGTPAPLSVRMIDDLNSVKYPPHIKPPNPALNYNAEVGKFKYDRNFLMQFEEVCKEKPKNLPDQSKEKFRLEKEKENKRMKKEMKEARAKAAEDKFRNSVMQSMGARIENPENLLALGCYSSKSSLNQSQFTQMGEFKFPPKTSEKRFLALSINRKSGTSSNTGSFERTLLPTASVLDILTEDFVPKVRALLNKLTLERFDSISDQIIEYVNRTRNEKDGRTLKEIIHLIIEESTSQNDSAMYAQLCHKIMDGIDPGIVDENVKNAEGKFFRGGTLFRKYLLNHCQESFEKGWKDIPVPSSVQEGSVLISDAKRKGLGLIRFIGEIFKLNMLTERIMHECIKKLLLFQDSPEQEEMESLCELMNIVGEQLDYVKINEYDHTKTNRVDTKQLMDSYFARMEEITKLPNLSNRIKFMIMDVIDLRNNAWKSRRKSRPKQRRKDDLSKFGSLNRSKISGNISLVPGGKFRYLL